MSDELIEQLSDAVHQNWMREKQAQGFADHVTQPCTFQDGRRRRCSTVCHANDAECILPADKNHTDMLPYADLPEKVKQYDRATVQAVLTALEGLGFAVIKTDDSSVRD